jgi:hypothetical protein
MCIKPFYSFLPLDCNAAAVDEFPEDLFTQSQRTHGAVLVHVAAAVYLIIALGSICDDYFVPVLEILCEALNLKPDVAGATFMAAGKYGREYVIYINALK